MSGIIGSLFLDPIRRLLGALSGGIQALTTEQRYRWSSYLFYKALLVWLMLTTATVLPFHDLVWGWGGLVPEAGWSGSLTDWILRLSAAPMLRGAYLFFPIAQLAVLAAALATQPGVILRLLVLLTTLWTNELNPTLLDGGHNLTELILLYMVLVRTSPYDEARPTSRPWIVSTTVSNVAFLMCQLQVCIVYLSAGILKLNGPLWQKGMALYYILQVDSYTHPIFHHLIQAVPAAAMVGTYFTLAFQYLFPVFVWFRRTRYWALLAGVALHMGISFVMGLFLFGLVMCTMYLMFVFDEDAQALLGALRRRSLRVEASGGMAGALRALNRRVFVRERFDLQDAAPSSAPGEAPALVAMEPSTGARWEGAAALVRISAQSRLWWLVSPVLWLLERLGRSTAPAAGSAAAASVPVARPAPTVLNAGVAAAALAGLCFHLVMTAVYLGPPNLIKMEYGAAVQRYMLPLFYQNWHLFSPNPSVSSTKLVVRCEQDGAWGDWQDPLEYWYEKHYRYRVTGHGKVIYAIRAVGTDLLNKLSSIQGACLEGYDEVTPAANKLCHLKAKEDVMSTEQFRRSAALAGSVCAITAPGWSMSTGHSDYQLKLLQMFPRKYSERDQDGPPWSVVQEILLDPGEPSLTDALSQGGDLDTGGSATQ